MALSAGRHTRSASKATTPQIAGSETELPSAIANLVNNAVRYTPEGGRIDVAWRCAATAAGEFVGRRHRHRHRPRTPAAADRALLPRRRQPLARHRRHRPGPVDRQACGAAPWRRTRHPERARQGFDFQAGVSCRACPRPRAGSRSTALPWRPIALSGSGGAPGVVSSRSVGRRSRHQFPAPSARAVGGWPRRSWRNISEQAERPGVPLRRASGRVLQCRDAERDSPAQRCRHRPVPAVPAAAQARLTDTGARRGTWPARTFG